MPHIMIDLETLDTAETAVFFEIGAVEFCPATHQITRQFHCLVNPQDASAAGRTSSSGTLHWWQQQSEEARASLIEAGYEGVSLQTSLQLLAEWISAMPCSKEHPLQVWANSPSFDCSILKNAFKAAGRQLPWRYSNERDYRTLAALYPNIPMDRTGTHHSGLDDAISQAEHTMQLLSVHKNPTMAALSLLADIRVAAGDPEGKLMQDELLELIRIQKAAADLAGEILADLDQLKEQGSLTA